MSLALWVGAIVQGLCFAFLGWGTYLSLRVLGFSDITVDGSFTLGAAVVAVLLVAGVNPLLALLVAIVCGALAGVATGLMNTRLGINDLLSGILTMTALYSINLHIMGKANVSLLRADTLITSAQQALGLPEEVTALLVFAMLAALCWLFLYWFLRTDFGLALRATGNNPAMITALGVDTRAMKLVGLGMANGLVALAGALIAQYQGFADVGMGIGSLVVGIAAVIIGETLVGGRSLAWTLAGVALGSVAYRLVIALALRVGMNPLDLKLVTALFVLAALAIPRLRETELGRRAAARFRRLRSGGGKPADVTATAGGGTLAGGGKPHD
jgi:putative tryptophan/tyrosine transport system permease protein